MSFLQRRGHVTFAMTQKSQRPSLTIQTEYFDGLLKELRKLGVGAAVESDEPPKEDLSTKRDLYFYNHGEGDWNFLPRSSPVDKNRALYRDWDILLDRTKDNLKTFEQPTYRLPSTAEGDENVLDLLEKVNDLIRLCRKFKIAIPEARPETWPCLSVEFKSLRNKSIEGSFEFIDLPVS